MFHFVFLQLFMKNVGQSKISCHLSETTSDCIIFESQTFLLHVVHEVNFDLSSDYGNFVI